MTYEQLLIKFQRYIEKRSYYYGQDDSDIIADLQQEGRIGLYEAWKVLDDSITGHTSYCVIYIKKYMNDYLTKHGKTVRQPKNQINRLRKGQTTNPTGKEIQAIRITSLDKPLNEQGWTLSDVLSNDDQDPQIDRQRLINALKQVLTPKEYDILETQYGLECKYEYKLNEPQLGLIYGLTRQGVNIKIKKILVKLKDNRIIKQLYTHFLT
jgi:RNA polymerase sigma factor (sigma-70 family)